MKLIFDAVLPKSKDLYTLLKSFETLSDYLNLESATVIESTRTLYQRFKSNEQRIITKFVSTYLARIVRIKGMVTVLREDINSQIVKMLTQNKAEDVKKTIEMLREQTHLLTIEELMKYNGFQN